MGAVGRVEGEQVAVEPQNAMTARASVRESICADLAAAPARLAPAAALQLQRTIGNRAFRLLLARAPDPKLPNFSQGDFESCGAASLVTALMIYERAGSFGLMAQAIQRVLSYMEENKDSLKTKAFGKARDAKTGDDGFNETVGAVISTRNKAISREIDAQGYEDLAHAFLYAFGNEAGLTDSEVGKLRKLVGLESGALSHDFKSWTELFDNLNDKTVPAGRIAQVAWLLQSDGTSAVRHDFLIGQYASGRWFLSDQGPEKPDELVADTPLELKRAYEMTTAGRFPRLYQSTVGPDAAVPFIRNFTSSIHLLDSGAAALKKDMPVPPGVFIAEIDKDVMPSGDRLYTWDFVGTYNQLATADKALRDYKGGHGGLIVEKPAGFFTLCKTSPVSETNLKAPGIDESDSKGGLKDARRGVLHAWLILSTVGGDRSPTMPVF